MTSLPCVRVDLQGPSLLTSLPHDLPRDRGALMTSLPPTVDRGRARDGSRARASRQRAHCAKCIRELATHAELRDS